MKSQSFTELIVWQKAHQFVLSVYEITKGFPKEEIYGLTSQFRRAAVSIPANIAEGYRKRGKKDKVRYFNIAEGSLEECKYYLILSKDLKYIVDNVDIFSLAEEVSKLLYSYSKAIQTPDT
jgi:four helix bundle protein